ncbi:MAG: TIGR03936 family radical SAM-associated protein, partial [Lachnospiraceae bacterium]|nr:TIGR03936 family radical SAM-associated protein [Lachnospiraceae bacterium]
MKIRIRFSKTGILRFIGHLDLMRTFQKAAARADLPLRFSEGFHPHPLMSFASPLSVGETSRGEYMDTELTAPMSGAEILARLNNALPEEIRCLSIRQLPDEEKKKNNNAMAIFGRADYAVRIRAPYDGLLSASDPSAVITSYLAQPSRNIIKKTK